MRFTEKILDNLDRAFALLGLLISAVMFIWLSMGIGKYLEVAVLVFLGCSAYLWITRNREVDYLSSRISSSGRLSLCLGLGAVFFLLYSCSILIVVFRPELYSRPPSYFVIAAFMAAVLTVEIFSLPSRRSLNCFILFQIVLLGINLRFLPQLMFPGVVGVDPWFHQMFTYEMLETGHIPGGYGYSMLPVMHLIIGTTSLATGLSYPLASMASVSLIQVIIYAVFSYLVGRLLRSARIGLGAALLLMVAPDVLRLGFWIYPGGFSVIWILIVMYILFRLGKQKSAALVCVSLLLMGVSILSHTVSALALAILLFCFWISFKALGTSNSRRIPVSLSLCLLFTVSMLSWWMYASGHMTRLMDVLRWGLRLENLIPGMMDVSSYLKQIAYSEYLLSILGFLSFYFFAMIGSLQALSPTGRERYMISMVVGGAVLTVIAFLSLPLGLGGLITQRWFSFSQLVLAIPAVMGLVSFSYLLPSRRARKSLLVVLVTVISFLAITNPETNFDGPVYTKDLTARFSLTVSEMEGLDFISRTSNQEIAAVYPDIYYLQFAKGKPVVELSPFLATPDFTGLRSYALAIRHEITVHPFVTSGGVFKLDYDLVDTLEKEKYTCFYSNGALNAFIWTK